MEKRKFVSAVILLAYSIPYAFLALCGDKEWDTALLYGVLICVTAVLGWICRKTDRIRLGRVGNLLSCITSCLCANLLWSGEVTYFKPFSAVGFVLTLSILVFMLQYIIWYCKRDNDPARSLILGVFTVTLGLVVIGILVLYVNMWKFTNQ